jgi:hypothetical protein
MNASTSVELSYQGGREPRNLSVRSRPIISAAARSIASGGNAADHEQDCVVAAGAFEQVRKTVGRGGLKHGEDCGGLRLCGLLTGVVVRQQFMASRRGALLILLAADSALTSKELPMVRVRYGHRKSDDTSRRSGARWPFPTDLTSFLELIRSRSSASPG